MRKQTRRERREQRERQTLLKQSRPPTRTAQEAAARLMRVRDNAWDERWAEIQYLDACILRAKDLMGSVYSEGIVIVAMDMMRTWKAARELLLVEIEYRPVLPGDLYTATSYAHKYL